MGCGEFLEWINFFRSKILSLWPFTVLRYWCKATKLTPSWKSINPSVAFCHWTERKIFYPWHFAIVIFYSYSVLDEVYNLFTSIYENTEGEGKGRNCLQTVILMMRKTETSLSFSLIIFFFCYPIYVSLIKGWRGLRSFSLLYFLILHPSLVWGYLTIL